jgi:nucleotide-binding universal stress UspA family protein
MQSSQTTAVDDLVASATTIFRRILVPVDFTMDSHRAVGVALALQREHGSAVCLFHAAESAGSDDWLGGIGSPSVGGDWVVESEARLRRFLDNVAPGASARVEVRARLGEAEHTVPRAARDWGATLVVAAASFHRRFRRSAAERLVHDLDVPTLILPTSD